MVGTAGGLNKKVIQVSDLADFSTKAKGFISTCDEMNDGCFPVAHGFWWGWKHFVCARLLG